ncbi:hypothetical protein EV421DRAFT_1744169 [Armillaria borealis]|uniref:Uncharacterized protein n=1 Tax=Armillaria borealis TaxID=47425 RepID=A0AA39ME33_9AGAR|nr:hypothetical protein EV421DRAFT_1744169 [Armillaria borealis]
MGVQVALALVMDILLGVHLNSPPSARRIYSRTSFGVLAIGMEKVINDHKNQQCYFAIKWAVTAVGTGYATRSILTTANVVAGTNSASPGMDKWYKESMRPLWLSNITTLQSSPSLIRLLREVSGCVPVGTITHQMTWQ